MEALIQAAERLKVAVMRCSQAITKESSNPLVQTILLESRIDEGGVGKLWLIVNDPKSHQLRMGVDADVMQLGAVILPNELFPKQIGRIPKDQFLRLDAGRIPGALSIQVGNERDELQFNLYEATVDDFARDTELPPVVATVDGERLTVALKECIASVERDDEIIFSGVGDQLHLYTHNESWSICSHIVLSTPDQTEDWTASTIVGILRNLPNWTGPVNIHKDDRVVAFSKGDDHLILRQVTMGGDFEHVEESLNKPPSGHFILNQRALKDKLSYLKEGKTKDAVSIDVKGTVVYIRRRVGLGKVDLKVPLQDRRGDTPDICFDPVVLTNAVESMSVTELRVETVSFDLGDGKPNYLYRLVDDKLPFYRQVIVLPMTEAPEED